jgi:hypothetical protein
VPLPLGSGSGDKQRRERIRCLDETYDLKILKEWVKIEYIDRNEKYRKVTVGP